jgi:hypothetical protein
MSVTVNEPPFAGSSIRTVRVTDCGGVAAVHVLEQVTFTAALPGRSWSRLWASTTVDVVVALPTHVKRRSCRSSPEATTTYAARTTLGAPVAFVGSSQTNVTAVAGVPAAPQPNFGSLTVAPTAID